VCVCGVCVCFLNSLLSIIVMEEYGYTV